MDLNEAQSSSATAGTIAREAVKKPASKAGNVFAFIILAIGALCLWWWWTPPWADRLQPQTTAAAPPRVRPTAPLGSHQDGISAPVGRWSPEIEISPGTCMLWERKGPYDQFVTEVRIRTSQEWVPQPTTGFLDTDRVRFKSTTNVPADVILTKHPGRC